LNTVTVATVGTLTSLAEMTAVRRVVLTKVVGRSSPFHLTTELVPMPVAKPVPLTVSVKPAPVTLESGERTVIVGTG
jgi:hypothetical protein